MTRQRFDVGASTAGGEARGVGGGLPLFDGLPQAPVTRPGTGQLECRATLKELLAAAMKSFSRYEVAARLSELVDRDIPKTTLDAWTAPSKDDHRLPADLIPAFVHATRNTSLVEELCRLCGGEFVPFEETRLLQKARIEREIAVLKQQLSRFK